MSLPCASRPPFRPTVPAGAEGVMDNVVFARPEQLDRRVNLLGDPRGLDRVVVLQPPAKAAAPAHHVRGDVALFDAECLGDQLQTVARQGAAGPHLQLAVLSSGLCSPAASIVHVPMILRYSYVASTTLADDLSARPIAIFAHRVPGRGLQQIGGALGEAFAALPAGEARSQSILSCLRACLRLPPCVCHNGDARLHSRLPGRISGRSNAAFNHQHMAHARQRLTCRRWRFSPLRQIRGSSQ